MKEKELFVKALSGLFGYWGGDTPPEALWGINDLLDWFEKEYDVTLNVRCEEDNAEEVMQAILNHRHQDPVQD